MKDLESLVAAAIADVAGSADLAALDAVRVAALGRKGTVTELLKGLGSLPADERKSAGARINAEWMEEASRHKWIQSEQAGRDPRDAAIRQWAQEHWWGYLRARWMEHLQGKYFWIELDRFRIKAERANVGQ